MKNLKRSHIVGFGLVWVFLLLAGIGWLERYSHTPGEQASIPAMWPQKSQLNRSSHPTLLVFFHPECSCSEATMSELDRLLVKIPKSTNVYAVFVQPDGWSEAETKGDLWKRATKIPNVKTFIDRRRTEATLFGTLTSGHTLLYDKGGKLIFSGGITSARGHEGDNEGEDAIVKLFNSSAPIELARARVFGCELFEK